MLAAVFIFAIMDALMKRLSSAYPPLQIACLRSLSSLAVLAAAILASRSWRSLRAAAPGFHVLRAVLGIAMLGSFVFAVHRLTLAQTYSLFLAAPLLMTALSVPLLGERVTLRRWAAIICGIGGVLIILQPWGNGAFSPIAAGAAAIATICYSLNAIATRSLGRRNSSLAMVFWYLAMVGVGSGLLASDDWHRIASQDWPWLAAIGVAGGLGQLWLTEAFRYAPPSVVGPFEYTAILWAFGIDWLFWSASPSFNLLLGAAIVIASGTVVFIDERRLAGLAAYSAFIPP
ncbi:MAG: DMT family transporter [Pseudomonadota bacterium]|nr:DMT family transporter [Pseudomonadota bacterium]